MARSIRDEMKRKAAQAINHLGGSVLDINDIYEAFKEHHPEDAEGLATVMVNIAMLRESVIAFALKSWELDETALMKYL